MYLIVRLLDSRYRILRLRQSFSKSIAVVNSPTNRPRPMKSVVMSRSALSLPVLSDTEKTDVGSLSKKSVFENKSMLTC